MQTRLTRFLWTVLAAIFLIEAWLWDVLGGLVARFVAALPIAAFRRRLQHLTDTLPPAFALALFIIPVLVVLPFKIAGLALIAGGRIFAGGLVFLAAKTAGLGVTAFQMMAFAGFAFAAAVAFGLYGRTYRVVDHYRAAA